MAARLKTTKNNNKSRAEQEQRSAHGRAVNKDEFVDLLAKSQEAILEHVDSKLQDLTRSISEDQEDCVRSVVKGSKKIIPSSGRKLVTRSSSNLTNLWKPRLIQLIRSWTR